MSGYFLLYNSILLLTQSLWLEGETATSHILCIGIDTVCAQFKRCCGASGQIGATSQSSSDCHYVAGSLSGNFAKGNRQIFEEHVATRIRAQRLEGCTVGCAIAVCVLVERHTDTVQGDITIGRIEGRIA